MFTPSSRRQFLKTSLWAAGAAAARPAWAVPNVLSQPSPNSQLNIAGIGVGGRGGSHVISALPEHLLAVCDVIDKTAENCLKRVDKAYKEKNIARPLPQVFADYREMLDKLHDKIDAVFVATPDHHHAPASMLAMRLGKHVYCEKPLTHSIFEARQLTLAARQYKVATQLGNQARATEGWRKLCEWVWAGVIGDVQEVHVWTDRPGIPTHPWWPQGSTRPAGSEPVPPGVHWDLWLGPAPERPFLDKYKDGPFKGKGVYQPFVWRGWWDFGTGALGDIGCHAISGIFSALKIEHAAAVELIGDSGDTTAEMYPRQSTIAWDIPARSGMAPCKLFWYDGGRYPDRAIAELPEDSEARVAQKAFVDNGAIIVGKQGKISFYGYNPRLLPESKMKDFQQPAASLPRCEAVPSGNQEKHFAEWVAACKGGRAAFSNFDHAGPLTEFVLLGNLAIRAGRNCKVQWDGPSLTCTNRPELNRFVRPDYRSGWTV